MSTNSPLSSLRRDLLHIVSGALSRAHAGRLVRDALVAPPALLARGEAVWLVAAGKAAGPMAVVFTGWARERLRAGVVIVPPAPGPVSSALDLPPDLALVTASHPSPNAGSEQAARRALATAAEAARSGGTLVLLLSGGASSLMALPAPGLTLESKAETARLLMQAGAAIDELNAVRKHLSAIKGGRLAAAAGRSVTLAVSDVVAPVPDDPSVIGSGPTVADPTTFGDALRIVERFGLRSRMPRPALDVLERGARGDIEETIKPGDPRLATATFRVIGSRLDALAGAREAARARGYAVVELEGPLVGEARQAGAWLAREPVVEAAKTSSRCCLLAAGETTVRVRGAGQGGRNQELALGAALEGLPGRTWALASVGTDGIDGPTDAAGAIADATTLVRAARAGLDARRFLDENDVYRFFEPLGDLIKTGPTGTNVGDIQIVLVSAE